MITHIKYLLIVSIAFLTSSCNGQINEKSNGRGKKELVDKAIKPYKYGAGDIVTKGYLDRFGNMWFTTLTEGVYRFDGENFKNFTVEDGLCSNHVNTVMEDKEGFLWFGTDKGLCVYDGTNFKNISLPLEHSPKVSPVNGIASRKTQEVLSMIQDEQGIFWLGTIASGAYRYDGETFTPYLRYEGRIQPRDSVYNNVIQSIVEDNENNIWFTSQTHGGITKYDGEVLTNYNLKDGLPDDMIFSSFKDADGNLWFGTLDNGLISYKKGVFSYFKESDWQNISCFYQTKSGKLWVGSFREESVLWFDGEKFNPVSFDPNKKLIELRFMAEDKEGNVWFGGRYSILYRYDGKELKDFTQAKRKS